MTSMRAIHSEARTKAARVTAVLGLAVGLAYAGISAYWATGETALIDTVGGSFERAGRSGGNAVTIGLWAVTVIKVAAAVLALLAISRRPGPR
jgi:hypothetical protein